MRVIIPRGTINPNETAVITIPDHLLNRPILRAIRSERTVLDAASISANDSSSLGILNQSRMVSTPDSTNLGQSYLDSTQNELDVGFVMDSTVGNRTYTIPESSSLGILSPDSTQENESLDLLNEGYLESTFNDDSMDSPRRRVTARLSRTFIVPEGSSLGILDAEQLGSTLGSESIGQSYLQETQSGGFEDFSGQPSGRDVNQTYTVPDPSSLGILDPEQFSGGFSLRGDTNRTYTIPDDSSLGILNTAQLENSNSLALLDQSYLQATQGGGFADSAPARNAPNRTYTVPGSNLDSEQLGGTRGSESLGYESENEPPLQRQVTMRSSRTYIIHPAATSTPQSAGAPRLGEHDEALTLSSVADQTVYSNPARGQIEGAQARTAPPPRQATTRTSVTYIIRPAANSPPVSLGLLRSGELNEALTVSSTDPSHRGPTEPSSMGTTQSSSMGREQALVAAFLSQLEEREYNSLLTS